MLALLIRTATQLITRSCKPYFKTQVNSGEQQDCPDHSVPPSVESLQLTPQPLQLADPNPHALGGYPEAANGVPRGGQGDATGLPWVGQGCQGVGMGVPRGHIHRVSRGQAMGTAQWVTHPASQAKLQASKTHTCRRRVAKGLQKGTARVDVSSGVPRTKIRPNWYMPWQSNARSRL